MPSTTVPNTFVIPVIRTDLLDRCLETLYERTPGEFYVYVVDQSPDGVDVERLRKAYRGLLTLRSPLTVVHPSGNLGFAKAVNFATALVETPMVTICNDDVEFVHSQWWPGVLDVFARVERERPHRPPMMVTPISVKLPHWAVGNPPGQDHYVLPYRRIYSDEDWAFLVGTRHVLNERMSIRPGTYLDGSEMFCSVLRVDRFREIGLLDERFYPGGGEDYDFSRRAKVHGYSCISTTQSWVYHHWGMSRRTIPGGQAPLDQNLVWNDLGSIWRPLQRDEPLTPEDLPPLTSRPL